MNRLERGNPCFAKARRALLACVLGLCLAALWPGAARGQSFDYEVRSDGLFLQLLNFTNRTGEVEEWVVKHLWSYSHGPNSGWLPEQSFDGSVTSHTFPYPAEGDRPEGAKILRMFFRIKVIFKSGEDSGWSVVMSSVVNK